MVEAKGDGKDKEKQLNKEYEVLKTKYGLPEFNDLDREFDIGPLESSAFLSRTLVQKIDEKCDYALKILGDMIQPENHIADMHEAEAFSDDEKKAVYETFRKLSYFHREFLIHDFEYDEKADCELIKKFFLEWKPLRTHLVKVLSKMRDSWKQEMPSDKEFGYFG